MKTAFSNLPTNIHFSSRGGAKNLVSKIPNKNNPSLYTLPKLKDTPQRVALEEILTKLEWRSIISSAWTGLVSVFSGQLSKLFGRR